MSVWKSRKIEEIVSKDTKIKTGGLSFKKKLRSGLLVLFVYYVHEREIP